jgi:hypothetical protein
MANFRKQTGDRAELALGVGAFVHCGFFISAWSRGSIILYRHVTRHFRRCHACSISSPCPPVATFGYSIVQQIDFYSKPDAGNSQMPTFGSIGSTRCSHRGWLWGHLTSSFLICLLSHPKFKLAYLKSYL